MFWTEISVTRDRTGILEDWHIKYAIDQDFCLGFYSPQDKEKAIKILKEAYVL